MLRLWKTAISESIRVPPRRGQPRLQPDRPEGQHEFITVRGLGGWNIDFSGVKNFLITEGKTLELKADMQNAFNHTQYTTVLTNLSGAGFGQVAATRSACVVQLKLRLAF